MSDERKQYRTSVEEHFPDDLTVGGIVYVKDRGLRYGRNPGQSAAFYRQADAKGPCIGNLEVVQDGGKKLGFINLEDADNALRIVRQLKDVYPNQAACSVIKHVNPSGVAKADSVVQAYRWAWDCNPLAAFGSVDAFSDEVDEETAKAIVKNFVEVVLAPGYTDGAKAVFQEKNDLRVLQVPSLDEELIASDFDYKFVGGGLLVEQRYRTRITDPLRLEVVSEAKPTPELLNAAIFNWLVCGFTRSNAIVIGDGDRTVGIGTGQQSRIDSFWLACWYANNRCANDGSKLVAASDAFFPARDCVDRAAEEGIEGIVYTLGSIRDKEVVDAANEHGIVMLATRPDPDDSSAGERCFTHH